MQSAFDIVFAGVLALTFVWLIWTRYYRLFPFFVINMALIAWQAAALASAGPMEDLWWEKTWVPVEYASLLFYLAATAEAIALRTYRVPNRKYLLIGTAIAPFSIVEMLHRIVPGSAYEVFIQYRNYFWLWMALVWVLGCWFCFVKGKALAKVFRSHAFIFMCFSIAHLVIASQTSGGQHAWFHQQTVFRAAAILCCAGWLLNARRFAVQQNEIDRPSRRTSAYASAGSTLPADQIQTGNRRLVS